MLDARRLVLWSAPCAGTGGSVNLSLPIIARLDPATLKGLSELEFQAAVTRHAETTGWRVQSFRKSAAPGKDGTWRGLGNPGWPDLICVRVGSGSENWGEDGVMLALELKSETGRASPEQTEWLALLAAVPGVTARLARPRDAGELMKLMEQLP